MSETNGKKEFNHVANDAVDSIPQDQRLTYLVSGKKGSSHELDKFEIYWLVPRSDEEAKERYDVDLSYLIEQGVRSLATRPNYPTVGFEDNGELKPDGHMEMQTLADGYQVGRKSPATGGQKAKASKFTALEKLAEKAGFGSVDEWIAAGAPQPE